MLAGLQRSMREHEGYYIFGAHHQHFDNNILKEDDCPLLQIILFSGKNSEIDGAPSLT